MARNLDFSFVREEAKGSYGRNGNVGLDYPCSFDWHAYATNCQARRDT